MTEVENLYLIANVSYKNHCPYISSCPYIGRECKDCELKKSSFDSKKQLDLFKILMGKDVSWSIVTDKEGTQYVFYIGYENSSHGFKKFPEAIAGIIIDIWENLTEIEKREITKILNEELR